MRGLWFYESVYQPLEEEYAREIEEFHLKNFLNQKIPSSEENVKTPQKGILKSMLYRQFNTALPIL